MEQFKRRGHHETYEYFKSPTGATESIVFFGGRDYLSLFCKLTAKAKAIGPSSTQGAEPTRRAARFGDLGIHSRTGYPSHLFQLRQSLGVLHHHQTPFPTGIRSSNPPAVFRKLFVGRAAPHTELLALRQQGAVLKRKRSRPSHRMSDGINGRDRPKECGRQYGLPAAWQSKMLAPLR